MERLIATALAEDVGSGDLTVAAVVPAGTRARAIVSQKEPGVISGLEVAREVFRQVDPVLTFDALGPEGEWREGGEVAAIEGPAGSILTGERTALNFLGRLSGVATATARHVRAVQGTGARILDTRKTTPGLRALEKQAVLHGGGVSHRGGLYDAILVKENHAALAGGIVPAARAALAASEGAAFVELEVESLDELDQALAEGVDRILLDNMGPDELREAVARCAGRASLEASGGITLETIGAVARTGVDYISVGALTHSAPALDLSLLLDPGAAAPRTGR
ncbi:MAG TPA: carboxylating nicotinate-nucleotide diphosphorylase [Thermoleophilaceae bacterium]|nr:carboxylating nicotinate-nucleotide diphosphorylase [Thermoleophilaceae bacterium]